MHKNPKGRITCILLVVLAVLIATPLSAAEKAKIKLPDGLYMYDSSTERQEDGHEMIGFEKYFIVHNNAIYSPQQAIRRFGKTKIKKIFTENKKFKVIFGGEQIGEIRNVEVDGDRVANHDKSFIKNIKEGPVYRVESIYIGRLGSAARAIAVPEKYQAARTISFNAISKDEVERISKLVKAKLLPLVIKRKELKQFKVKDNELVEERIDFLDKISSHKDEMYIGNYRYVFKTAHEGVCEFEILFCVKKDNVYVITSNYDDDILLEGEINISGMIDVDGCGEEELIIEKVYGGEAGVTTNLEIYKQQVDGNWMRIKKIKTRRAL